MVKIFWLQISVCEKILLEERWCVVIPKPQLARKGLWVNKKTKNENKTYQFQGSSAGLYLNYRKHFSIRSKTAWLANQDKQSSEVPDDVQVTWAQEDAWDKQTKLSATFYVRPEDGTMIKPKFCATLERWNHLSNDLGSRNGGKLKPSFGTAMLQYQLCSMHSCYCINCNQPLLLYQP